VIPLRGRNVGLRARLGGGGRGDCTVNVSMTCKEGGRPHTNQQEKFDTGDHAFFAWKQARKKKNARRKGKHGKPPGSNEGIGMKGEA